MDNNVNYVKIALTPFARKVWDVMFDHISVNGKGGVVEVYDVGDSPLYPMLRCGLTRRLTIEAGELREKKDANMTVGVRVAKRDVTARGYYVDRRIQWEMNRWTEDVTRRDVQLAAILDFLLKGTPLMDTYSDFMAQYNLDNDDINIATIKKDRLRRYKADLLMIIENPIYIIGRETMTRSGKKHITDMSTGMDTKHTKKEH